MREKQKQEREGSSRRGGRKGNDKGEDENKREELVKKRKKKKKQELIAHFHTPKSGRYSRYRTNWNSLNGSRNDSCQPSM